ncbi:hypothetical protein CYMTET_40086 [Cymbomonas tetramitiformis]|uniref:2Fe-2S ferredoxin-type domain-containing protein n=1 Tax=Cymbomonas tetramitiformis TaxID=36881 RepID=A0AAE0F3L4_9CHLO|nr:hypothetical protein CYMTET_40086 [Cymbomonas tetramitiformis]
MSNCFVATLKPGACRGFAASSSLPPEEEAQSFIEELGYSKEIARGIVSALKSFEAGLQDSQILPFVKQLAGRWEVGEDAGLEAMALSVQQELARTEGRAKVHFTIVAGNRSFDCEGYDGLSLLDIIKHQDSAGAQELAEVLECACSGIMACSTCQVIVHPDWFERVGEPEEEEQDMLDLAFDPQPTSRLGCQLVLKPELEGLVLTIPSGANNLFDHIPFE